MKLIYYISYGTKQQDLLRLSVESARRAGGFQGEITIFSDLPIEVSTANVVLVPPL